MKSADGLTKCVHRAVLQLAIRSLLTCWITVLVFNEAATLVAPIRPGGEVINNGVTSTTNAPERRLAALSSRASHLACRCPLGFYSGGSITIFAPSDMCNSSTDSRTWSGQHQSSSNSFRVNMSTCHGCASGCAVCTGPEEHECSRCASGFFVNYHHEIIQAQTNEYTVPLSRSERSIRATVRQKQAAAPSTGEPPLSTVASAFLSTRDVEEDGLLLRTSPWPNKIPLSEKTSGRPMFRDIVIKSLVETNHEESSGFFIEPLPASESELVHDAKNIAPGLDDSPLDKDEKTVIGDEILETTETRDDYSEDSKDETKPVLRGIIQTSFRPNILETISAINHSSGELLQIEREKRKESVAFAQHDDIHATKLERTNPRSKLSEGMTNDHLLVTIDPDSKTNDPDSKTIDPASKTIDPDSKTIDPDLKTIVINSKTIESLSKTINPNWKTTDEDSKRIDLAPKQFDLDSKTTVPKPKTRSPEWEAIEPEIKTLVPDNSEVSGESFENGDMDDSSQSEETEMDSKESNISVGATTSKWPEMYSSSVSNVVKKVTTTPQPLRHHETTDTDAVTDTDLTSAYHPPAMWAFSCVARCPHGFYANSRRICRPCDRECNGCHGDGPERCVACRHFKMASRCVWSCGIAGVGGMDGGECGVGGSNDDYVTNSTAPRLGASGENEESEQSNGTPAVYYAVPPLVIIVVVLCLMVSYYRHRQKLKRSILWKSEGMSKRDRNGSDGKVYYAPYLKGDKIGLAEFKNSTEPMRRAGNAYVYADRPLLHQKHEHDGFKTSQSWSSSQMENDPLYETPENTWRVTPGHAGQSRTHPRYTNGHISKVDQSYLVPFPTDKAVSKSLDDCRTNSTKLSSSQLKLQEFRRASEDPSFQNLGSQYLEIPFFEAPPLPVRNTPTIEIDDADDHIYANIDEDN